MSADTRWRRSSLAGRQTLTVSALLAAGVTLALIIETRVADALLAGALTLLLMIPLTLYVVRRSLSPLLSMFRALAGTVTSYRDGDFGFGLRWQRNDELGDLVTAHNALGDTLREQRQSLVQRELLLDTMVQNTPVAMLLCDPNQRVVYANLAGRKLLNRGRRMEGTSLDVVLEGAPAALREAVDRGGDGLFAVGRDEEEEEVYHLARRDFRLNGRRHELFLLRALTAELRRQEVRTWKKVIRVISHELNNSLAPMSSLAHSGAELVRRGEHDRLEEVFTAIEERTRHLNAFIQGYAKFAKLPAPRSMKVTWRVFVERLQSQVEFVIDGALPAEVALFDPGQVEQALLNLLRNAHESGSRSDEVRLRVRHLGRTFSIEVTDRGNGMTKTVLESALLPFYSTKRGGTGLGLALVREIAEAQGGRVAIANREGGGLSVTLVFPQ